MLEQCLPFTVLKLKAFIFTGLTICEVVTVLTVYGIETLFNKIKLKIYLLEQCLPFTVLKPHLRHF